MSKLTLVRIDDRLIHGQVVVKWLRHLGSNEVVIVDDDLWVDDDLKRVLRLATPPGVRLHVVPVDQASRILEDPRSCLSFAERDVPVPTTGALVPPVTRPMACRRQILMLVKTPHTALALLDKGVSFPELNVGGLAGGEGRTRVYRSISVTPEQLDILQQIDSRGVRVYFQTVPEERALELSEVTQVAETAHWTAGHVASERF